MRKSIRTHWWKQACARKGVFTLRGDARVARRRVSVVNTLKTADDVHTRPVSVRVPDPWWRWRLRTVPVPLRSALIWTTLMKKTSRRDGEAEEVVLEEKKSSRLKLISQHSTGFIQSFPVVYGKVMFIICLGSLLSSHRRQTKFKKLPKDIGNYREDI